MKYLSVLVVSLFFLQGEYRADDGNGEENLLPNSGFEEMDGEGKPAGWQLPSPVYSLETNGARTGEYCLKYVNDDRNRYQLGTMPVTLTPGRRYAFEVWVRTEGIEGEDSGATVCVEWSDAGGKYLGGSYPAGIKGTSTTWQCVRGITGIVPEQAASFGFTCYVRKFMTGTAWFDDARLTLYRPSLALGITSDAYRDMITDETVTIRVGILPSEWNLTPEQIVAQLRLENDRGERVLETAAGTVSGTMVSFEVSGAKLDPGRYTAAVKVAGPSGKGSCEVRMPMERLSTRTLPKVYIDRQRRLIVDGRPFFPLGMYWGGIKEDQLDIYAASAFNCLMPYSRPDRKVLDSVQQRGLRVIYSIKDYYAGTKWCPGHIRTEADEEPAVRETVAQYKDHPALLAWYINDELPLSLLDRLSARRRLMEELDPDHPTWVVLYQVSDVCRYLPSFDVVGTDPYPIPNRPVSTALDWARMTVAGGLESRAVWMVPQVFDWAAYKKTPEEKEKYRAPTLLEIRSMAWQCIAAGANGLVFYSWFDLWKMDGKDPFDERWRDVSAMASEISSFIPVILSDAASSRPKTPELPRGVAWRTWSFEANGYLLAVNSGDEYARARFDFARDLVSVECVMGETAAEIRGHELTLTFSPLEPKMIRFRMKDDG